jgi:hypothetical protein
MEGHPGEVITDNFPLDKGKISAMEGGIRVPLIITGPGIRAGVESDVMVNGLDFYPTILTLTKTPKPKDKNLDGCDLSDLLRDDPSNSRLVRDKQGKTRNSMIWHFPHSVALESSIRVEGFKLIRNYDHKYNPNTPELELYQLYRNVNGKQVRVDLEEANNLVASKPELANELNRELTSALNEMNASYPYYNPRAARIGMEKNQTPRIISHERKGKVVRFAYQSRGSEVVRADLIYTLNGNQRYEEWFRALGELEGENMIKVQLPEGTTHYFLNLIDRNNFLVSYPQCPDYATLNQSKDPFSKFAISAR